MQFFCMQALITVKAQACSSGNNCASLLPCSLHGHEPADDAAGLLGAARTDTGVQRGVLGGPLALRRAAHVPVPVVPPRAAALLLPRP